MEQIAIAAADIGSTATPAVDPRDLLYVQDNRPTALLIATGFTATGALLHAGGARLLDTVSLADAQARLDLRTHIDLIVVDCAQAEPALLPLLIRLQRLAVEEDVAVVALCSLDTLDQVYGQLSGTDVQLLCTPDPFDLAAAIALALSRREKGPRFHDIGGENESARIERLSQEVSRLARVLDSLTSNYANNYANNYDGAAAASPAMIADRTNVYMMPPPETLSFASPTLEAGQVRDLLRVRRQRDQFFPSDLFADPAWDMMLDLMAARLAGERVSVSSLCIAAAVPPTTALRWIRQLTDRKLLVRQADPADGRRVFIALSDDAAHALTRWFMSSRMMLREVFA